MGGLNSDVERDRPALRAGLHLENEVRSLLDHWYGDVAARASEPWMLRLRSGSANSGYGTERVLYAYISGEEYAGDVHDWDKETSHRYPTAAKLNYLQVASWRPDESIELCLYGERSVYRGGTRYKLIHAKSGGPLAMIRLHQAQRIKDSRAALHVEVVDCPGPSPRLVAEVRSGRLAEKAVPNN